MHVKPEYIAKAIKRSCNISFGTWQQRRRRSANPHEPKAQSGLGNIDFRNMTLAEPNHSFKYTNFIFL